MKDKHSVSEVTIVGGTHGNEYLGPYFIRKVEEADLYQNNSLKVSTLLANPEAFAKGLRFIDRDLNRSFSKDILDEAGDKKNLELQRAQEIHENLGLKKAANRFIIDLHSTTANMGVTLIVRNDQPFNLHAASYVQQNLPETRILVSDVDREQSRSLNTISDFGLAVEIGPIANSVIRQDLFDTTEKVVSLLIKFLTLCATRAEPRLPDEVTVYQARDRVSFPRNSQGQLTAMVHRDLQDRDYRLLEPGKPIFRTFDDKDILFDGKEGHAVFINEAAYYREDVAFIITDKISLPVKDQ